MKSKKPPIEKTDKENPEGFCVFRGDLVQRVFARLGIGTCRPVHVMARILLVLGVTWMPMGLMSLFVRLPPDALPAQNFFYDFAAYAQFFVGLPLFIIAECVVSESLSSAARDFAKSGVVAKEDRLALTTIEHDVATVRTKLFPDLICIGIAFVMSLLTIGPEMFLHSDMQSWHVTKLSTSLGPWGIFTALPTSAGAWEMLIALPIQIYWWVRWMWKVGLWYWYLLRVSRLHLVLVASHPDYTGGIGFLSEAQARFAIIILAFGISNVVATIGYKLGIEHAPIGLPGVWGPVVGFVIGAPLLFLAPLLLFTKQLYRVKKKALEHFRDKAMTSALHVEGQWLHIVPNAEQEANARLELAQLNLLTGFYDRISGMRVVPFDLRSASQLIGSAVGPMIPLIPYFIHLPEPVQKALEALVK